MQLHAVMRSAELAPALTTAWHAVASNPADDAADQLTAASVHSLLLQKLVFMYVVLEVAAGLLKGNNPIQHLLLAAIHLKMVFRAMLAPLSMMCSGFVLALVQYSLLLKKQQRSHSSNQAIGQEAAAVAGKSKAE